MENKENTANEIGDYIKDYILRVICSFDELIKVKNVHDKNIYRVIKDSVVDIRLQAGEKLVDNFFDARLSSYEKNKLKDEFGKTCEKIIKQNLAEKTI